MRIALCDDELLAQQTLLELVETFGEKRKLRFEIDAFASGEDFLASAQTYDIVFMDIYLTGISGMAAVERLGGSELCQVVFTTVSLEHAVEAFGLNAAHYLVKPLTAQTVAAAMERCLSRLGQNPEKFLMVKMGQGVVPVSMGKIVYIEVQDKLCTIHTEKK